LDHAAFFLAPKRTKSHDFKLIHHPVAACLGIGLQCREKPCLLAGIGNIVLVMNAIETTGIVDAQHQLRLDEPLPIAGQSRVKVIVLVPEEADLSESAWTKATATSPAFDFLKDAAEDVYTAADGKPFHDQG
jgi:hypothetical protein